MKFKLYFLSFLGFLYFNQIFLTKSSADIGINSIIKIFCMENVKSEMINANRVYTKSFGNKVCNCYLKNIEQNIEHEKSILKCKEEINKNLN